MSFPVNGEIKNTKWEFIARRCLPASHCPDINRIGLDFVNYLQMHCTTLNHPTVSSRFQYFCKHLANRNHDQAECNSETATKNRDKQGY